MNNIDQNKKSSVITWAWVLYFFALFSFIFMKMSAVTGRLHYDNTAGLGEGIFVLFISIPVLVASVSSAFISYMRKKKSNQPVTWSHKFILIISLLSLLSLLIAIHYLGFGSRFL